MSFVVIASRSRDLSSNGLPEESGLGSPRWRRNLENVVSAPKARRALEMLARRPIGVTERLMLPRGFSRRMLLGLVKQRLAILTYEMVRPDGKTLDIGKMQITAAGRNALAAED